MRYILIFLFVLDSLIPATAQTSLLPLMGLKEINEFTFQEYKGNYYFFTQKKVASPSIAGYTPCLSFLNKCNAGTNVITQTVAVFGDTIQIDSVSSKWLEQYIITAQNKIYLFYTKYFISPTLPFPAGLTKGLYYQVLDTGLNIVIPEKQVKFFKPDNRFWFPYIKNGTINGNKISITYTMADSLIFNSVLSKYLMIDTLGNITQEDTLGIAPVIKDSTGIWHVGGEIHNYPGNRYFVTGWGILNYGRTCMYLADSVLNIIDTFYAPELIGPSSSGDSASYAASPPNMLVLPTGSVIVGAFCWSTAPGIEITAMIGKQNAAKRYAVDTSFKVYKGKDSLDKEHMAGPSEHSLAYNENDNLVYFANSTHAWFGGCSTRYNYVQVICVDTNIQTKWVKYIYSGFDSCAYVSYVTACHERSGVLICGYRNPGPNGSFVYRIDSSGAPTGIANTEGLTIRNRIEIYPNPTNDYVFIDDIKKQSGTVYVYNMQGALVLQQAVNSNHKKIDLGMQGSGLYILKLHTDDDETYSFKVIRQ